MNTNPDRWSGWRYHPDGFLEHEAGPGVIYRVPFGPEHVFPDLVLESIAELASQKWASPDVLAGLCTAISDLWIEVAPGAVADPEGLEHIARAAGALNDSGFPHSHTTQRQGAAQVPDRTGHTRGPHRSEERADFPESDLGTGEI